MIYAVYLVIFMNIRLHFRVIFTVFSVKKGLTAKIKRAIILANLRKTVTKTCARQISRFREPVAVEYRHGSYVRYPFRVGNIKGSAE